MKKKWIYAWSRERRGRLQVLSFARRTLFCMIVGLLIWCPEVSAQNELISLKMKDASLVDVLKEITKKSGYDFLYNFDVVEAQERVSVDEINVRLNELLKKLLPPRGLSFEFKEKLVIIRKVAKIQQDSVKSVQERTIRGIVTDEAGSPLPGVTVRIKGTQVGVATDMGGSFRLMIPKSVVTLIFSFVGMDSQEITVKNLAKDEDLKIVMKAKDETLEDVVVTGYGNIKKSSFTGSSTHVKREELLKVSSGNVIDALQVFDPSLRVVKNNEMGSDPNTLPEFYVRGRSGIASVSELDKLEATQSGDVSRFSLTNNPNTPIFILDGYEISVEKVYDFDVTRIESITILKDAAATAIYGSRASNGVIVIESVAPREGELRVSYNFVGTITAPDLSDYNLMNASEKLEAEVLFGLLDGSDQVSSNFDERQNDYLAKMNQIALGVDTYWLSQPLTTELNHKHSLYIEGGSEMIRYGIDLFYGAQNGVMKGSSRNTVGAGISLDYRRKKIQFRNTVSVNVMNAKDSPYGVFSDYVAKQPYDTPRDAETGKFMETLPKHFEYDNNLNPLYEATLGSFSKSNYKEFTDNLGINWYILEGLQFKAQFALSYKDSKTTGFTDPKSGEFLGPDIFTYGRLQKGNTESLNWNTNLYLMYTNSFNKHDVNFRVGFNAKEDKANYDMAEYRGFASADFHDVQYAKQIVDKPSVSDNHTRLIGAFVSLNYTYNDIYLLDGSLRWDGSSEFGTDKRVASFWSVGAGINVHNYKFMAGLLPFMNQLRFTGNYGITGKLNFPPYAARHTYDMLLDDWYTTGIGSFLSYMGNEKLKWEKQKQSNLAVDVALFKNRVSFGFSWYDKKTVDLITDVALPPSSGFGSYKENLGKIQNKGYEVNVNLLLYRSEEWDVRFFARAAHNENKILKISESLQSYNERVDRFFEDYNERNHDLDYAKPFLKYEVGGSLTSIYGMRSLGIVPLNGKELYMDRNGNVTYLWNSAEQQILGDKEPDLQGSFGFNFRYKGFSLYTTFMFEYGGQTYNQTLVDRVENVDLYTTNADKRILKDKWRKEGDISSFKDIKDRLKITHSTSRFVQDQNTLTFNSLSLGYDFDTNLVKRWGLSMMRLQFNMKDVATISTVEQERGLSYPFARSFDFTLNIGF